MDMIDQTLLYKWIALIIWLYYWIISSLMTDNLASQVYLCVIRTTISNEDRMGIICYNRISIYIRNTIFSTVGYTIPRE
jgi:hypothetical protein